ncbi:MAG TPA: aromatic ring-hydroxylating dioxygenase subunit alpha [Candidatus Caenarcaniphilales bacterium]|nr:aromatic ring-hydroxylating dioxygenase subunit alpha [Candidatus Caenarcaniphilales bacterium]
MTVTTPDVARASTLPSRFYLDDAALDAEKERVFARTWQLVARLDDLARPGEFVPATIVDEPLVITHGLDSELRGFYNVCRHRAGQVALAKGNRKSLQCRYHGWTYGLDATLRACPEMEGTDDFRVGVVVQLPIFEWFFAEPRFSAKRENGVHHFQQLVREFLGEQ